MTKLEKFKNVILDYKENLEYYSKQVDSFLRSFIYSIKNLITWFPIIWRDRWWDYYWFLVLIRFKLKLMEKNFRTKAFHLHADKDADNIKKCIDILDKLIEDNYFNELYDKFEKTSKAERDFISRSIEINREHNKIFEEEDKLIQSDINKLFDCLKRLREWWD